MIKPRSFALTILAAGLALHGDVGARSRRPVEDDWLFVAVTGGNAAIPRVALTDDSDPSSRRGAVWHTHRAELAELEPGVLVVRAIGSEPPASRARAAEVAWELTRVVLVDGDRVYTSALRETDVSGLRVVEDPSNRPSVEVGAADVQHLQPEHWLIWPVTPVTEADEPPAILSAHMALALDTKRVARRGRRFLDVLTGAVLDTPFAWKSRPVGLSELSPGTVVARIELAPCAGEPPGTTRRALASSWTVGPIEEVSGRRAKLHGRWSDASELRLVLDAR